MKEMIFDEKNGLWYQLVGDYYLPCFSLPEQDQSIGVWGMRHRDFLREHKQAAYTELLLTGRLNSYLAQIDTQAQEMNLRLIDQMAADGGITEQLKAEDQMAWVGAMMNTQSRAREIVNHELIYSPLSDNEYVRRYHFVEGLARDWKGVEIQEHTQTKKFKSYPTPFSTRKGAADAFDKLFKKFSNSILVVSYSSNSQPTQDEMVAIMAKYKKHVEVVPIDYKYSFGNQNDAKTHRNSVQEYLFVGY